MKKVTLSHVSKSYDQQSFAVDDVNVEINPGEFFVLVGPSGCGKSTMLRMIAGLETITAGDLSIGENRVNHMPPSKREISMVFQNYALYPHLTVEENILFGLKARKMNKTERNERCQEAAELLGLTPYLQRKPRELSGGQRQRVALARTVVSQRPICLLDEPLSNLDAKLRGYMRTEIRQLQKKLGITMIYVTHDQVEAMTMGDRMMVLKDGKVQQVGTPLSIYNEPKNLFVATFIGAPPMNTLPLSLSQDRSLMFMNEKVSLAIPVSWRNLLNTRDHFHLGVRPEQVLPAEEVLEPSIKFDVTIADTEVLGNETHFTFTLGKATWKAKWQGQWPKKIGAILSLAVPLEAAYLFDTETEELFYSGQVQLSEGVQVL